MANDWLQSYLVHWVDTTEPFVVKVQSWLGVDSLKGSRSSIIHYLMTFGAALGNEMFFILFLPWLFWHWDLFVARRIIYLWSTQYYVGQYLKDHFELPRPRLKSVFQLERHYATEYGLPSTHAMNAVSMPAYILLLSWDRLVPEASGGLLVASCVAWAVLCVVSRLYMGVHTPADLIAGMLVGATALFAHLRWADALDTFVLTSEWAPLVLLILTCLLVWVYPRPIHWVNSPGDTTLILGVAVGVCFAANLDASRQINHTIKCENGCIHTPTLQSFLSSIPGLLLCYGVLFMTRSVIKFLSIPVALFWATGSCRKVGSSATKPSPEVFSAMSTNKSKNEQNDYIQPIKQHTNTNELRRRHDTCQEDTTFAPSPSSLSSVSVSPVESSDTERTTTYVVPPKSNQKKETHDSISNGSSLSNEIYIKSDESNLHSTVTDVTKRYDVELPVKLLTYACVGFNAVYTCPYLLNMIGLV